MCACVCLCIHMNVAWVMSCYNIRKTNKARYLQGNKNPYLFFQSLILTTPDPISKVIYIPTLLH